jgi:hypothetical protein
MCCLHIVNILLDDQTAACVCVCVYVYMYVCNVCIIYVCMYVCMYVCVCVCVCMHVSMFLSLLTGMFHYRTAILDAKSFLLQSVVTLINTVYIH